LNLKSTEVFILPAQDIAKIRSFSHQPLLENIESEKGKTISRKFKIESLGTLDISDFAIRPHYLSCIFDFTSYNDGKPVYQRNYTTQTAPVMESSC